jgi:hypothetical protein
MGLFAAVLGLERECPLLSKADTQRYGLTARNRHAILAAYDPLRTYRDNIGSPVAPPLCCPHQFTNGGRIMEAINWEAVSALSEALGVLVVVGSLIFVGFQMRQTAKAINVNSNHGIQEAFRDNVMRIAESDVLSSIFQREISKPGSVTGLEEYRFALLLQSSIQLYANAYYQHKVGALDAATWDSLDAQFGNFLKTPGARAYWQRSGSNYPKDFENYLNNEVLTAPQQEGYRLRGT